MISKKRDSYTLIGQILTQQRSITEPQLEEALLRQKKLGHKSRLGDLLIEMGYAKERDIIAAFSAQYAIPFIQLDNCAIPADTVRSIPCEIADKYCVMPISKLGSILTVAIAGLLPPEQVAHLEAISECKVRFVLTSASSILRAIETYYRHHPTPEPTPTHENTVTHAVQPHAAAIPASEKAYEKRRGHRIILNWETLVMLPDGTTKTIKVINVSSLGAAIVIDEPLAEDEQIKLMLFNANFLAQMLKPEFHLMHSIAMKRVTEQLTVMLSAFSDFVPKKDAWCTWSKEEAKGRWRVGLRFQQEPVPVDLEQMTL